MSSMSSQWILISCKYIREFSYSSPSCSVLLFPVTSSQALSYPSISCSALLFPVTSSQALSYPNISYSVPYCLALSLFVLFCFVVLWRGVVWRIVSCRVSFMSLVLCFQCTFHNAVSSKAYTDVSPCMPSSLTVTVSLLYTHYLYPIITPF